MRKICFVVSSPITAATFLSSHIRKLQREYAVTLIANTDDLRFLHPLGVELDITPIPIDRRVNLKNDLISVYRLYKVFRKENFDLVHSLTPKAGLLAMLSAYAARIPLRLHWFTGQVWVIQWGPKRWFLKALDLLTAALATHVLVDSPSQRDFLVSERVIRGASSEVLAHGSVCGVDPDRFQPNEDVSARIRGQLGVPQDAVVLTYVGRLNKDKGIEDLAKAFSSVAARLPKLWLVLVGPDEQNMWVQVSEICFSWMGRVCFFNHTDNPEHYMAAADIFCLPSYREGFGSAAIEAASCALPTVATRIYGLVDAVEDGVSGFLYTPGDVDGLAGLIERLYRNPQLRLSVGEQGRIRATKLFSEEALTTALASFYTRILQSYESRS